MNLNNILIVCDKEQLINSYEMILKPYGDTAYFVISQENKIENINFLDYRIIVADLNILTNIKEFLELAKYYDFKRQIVILISAFDSLYLQKIEDSLKNISFIIKKPFLTSKLTDYLANEIYKFKQINLISNKADILIDIIDLHPSKIAVYDYDGNFFYANMNYITSYKIDLNQKNSLLFDEIKSCEQNFSYIKSKLFVLKTFTVQHKEHNIWLESVFFYTNSKYIIHIVSDITSSKQKEIRLELASSFFENTNEGIIITNSHGIIQSVNKAFSEITGYSQDDVIGKNPNILKSSIHDKQFYENMWHSLKAHGYYKGEIWNKRKNGEVYPQIISISKAINEKYQEEYYLSIFTDISTLKEADKKVAYFANFDSLTTLPNRSNFEKQLTDSINSAKKHNQSFAIFFIDLDKFKEVNDTHGHDVGDQMLINISKRFLNSIRKDDVIARIGGDEFILIAKNIENTRFIHSLAQKIQTKISQPLSIENQVFNMTLSMGIAIYPDHGHDRNDLLKNADIAMYEVKEKGRDGYKIYNEDMANRVVTKVSMQKEIRRGILRDEFIMYYQPIIDFETHQVIGAEALVRWQHPLQGLLSPANFLPYMISGDMEELFGDMVVTKVMQDIQTLNKAKQNNLLTISINISQKQFYNVQFCNIITKIAQNFGISPSQVELEILETQIMKDKELAKDTIDNLHKMGFRISLDDFGTEYSSMNYLKYFKVDKIKIDQSFIKNMLIDKDDRNITKAIIHLAKLFNLKVQAEGVETKEHFDVLKQYNCDFSQGYYHSKPLSLG